METKDKELFNHFQAHYNDILAEMHSAPDFPDKYTIPEEWDREFRKTIERICESQE